jgi:2-polyprenyl-3-methyl-5-hydroxy-6-metoxy-1,4-benzoquinol methylase
MKSFVPEGITCALDIGCGAGGFGRQLSAAEIWGVEPSAEACAEASTHYSRVFNMTYADAESEIPNARFDLIICNDVIEHIADHEQFLTSVRSKLASNGYLVGSVPNVRYFENLCRVVWRGEWEYSDSGILDRTHLRFFTQSSLRKYLEGGGFSLEKMTGINSIFKKGVMRKKGVFLGLTFLSLLSGGRMRDLQFLQLGFCARKV